MPPKAASAQQKSPAEFFAEQKTIAGFDNPGKSLFTTMRELVENGLDSAESMEVLPDIDVVITEVTTKEYEDMVGLRTGARVNESLYRDHESADARRKREDKEAKELEKARKKGGEEAVAKKREAMAKAERRAKAKAQRNIYTVTVRDNGMGMPHDEIPRMFGIVLSSTKYAVRQARGKYGLGAKMALIWAKMSTGLPIEVFSSQEGSDFTSYCKLGINLQKNKPDVIEHEKQPRRLNDDGSPWHGAELRVTIEGDFTMYKSKIGKYLQQMAVITPYAQFRFRYDAKAEDKCMDHFFSRRTDSMPQMPEETKHHPSHVDLELLKKLMGQCTKSKKLKAFFMKDFTSINSHLAGKLMEELEEDGIYPGSVVSDLDDSQIVRIHQLFHTIVFPPPDGDCLSPAGEYNLNLGVHKEFKPDLCATARVEAGAYEGHPFLVEAAVSIGGKDVKAGLNVFRFANRIPLLFEPGSDVCKRTADRLKWSTYKIDAKQDKVGVFVSIVSTKIPFKGTSKEYISDEIEEIRTAVHKALQICGNQLKTKIARAQAHRSAMDRKKNMTKYIPNASRAIFGVLEDMATDPNRLKRTSAERDGDGGLEELQAIAKKIKSGELTEETLREDLKAHVEQVDRDLAEEFAAQMGGAGGGKAMPRQDFFLALHSKPAGARHPTVLHSPTCVLELW